MSQSPAVEQDERDQRLARLLEELSRQQQQDRRPDLDAVAADHPDLIDELRQLLNVAQLAEQFAPAAASSRPTISLPFSCAPAPGVGLGSRCFDGYELLEE